MPEIGKPIFYDGRGSLEILSPAKSAHAVEERNYSIQCKGGNSSIYAVTKDDYKWLNLLGLKHSAELKIDNSTALAVITNNNDLISLKVTYLSLIDDIQKSAITDIECKETNGCTTISIFTDSTVAASCYKNGRYLTLDIAPCKRGLLFECDAIDYMVTENKSNSVKYIFALNRETTDCYIEEYDDRIILYLRY